MKKLIITVLCKDRPGIISLVSNALYEFGCNLENANQMILQDQFAGFFIVEPPRESSMEEIRKVLNEKTKGKKISVHVDTLKDQSGSPGPRPGETFLITTIGPDQKGLVARFSKIIAGFNANIENLKAVFKGGSDPNDNIMSYQVFVTPDIDTKKFFNALREKAGELELDIRIQHKNIFDAINKI